MFGNNNATRPEKPSPFDLQVIGGSVQGRSHHATATPNQDAIDWWPRSEAGSSRTCIAVADGHGSYRHFRSDTGSRLAVETMIDHLRGLAETDITASGISAIKRIAEEQLPRSIVRSWRQAVLKHHRDNPYTRETPGCTTSHQDIGEQNECDDDVLVAYGSTVLGVLFTEMFALYIQLGDGDILHVDSTGKTSRPLISDERLIANETSSLCTRSAWKEFRVRLIPHAGASPAMVLACTDGYANSFPSDDVDFLKIGTDYLDRIRERGLVEVADLLPAYLEETTHHGSCDDITLGLISRSEGNGVTHCSSD